MKTMKKNENTLKMGARSRDDDEPAPSSSSTSSNSKGALDLLSCGFLSGIIQAIIFNPWDRALYLSIKVYYIFIQ